MLAVTPAPPPTGPSRLPLPPPPARPLRTHQAQLLAVVTAVAGGQAGDVRDVLAAVTPGGGKSLLPVGSVKNLGQTDDCLSRCRFPLTGGFQWSKVALTVGNVHAVDRPQARMAVALGFERREAAR
jgi:hypothetical protein